MAAGDTRGEGATPSGWVRTLWWPDRFGGPRHVSRRDSCSSQGGLRRCVALFGITWSLGCCLLARDPCPGHMKVCLL